MIERELDALCSPRAPRRRQMPGESYEKVRTRVPRVFQRQCLKRPKSSVKGSSACDIDSQDPNDASFIITAPSAPDPFSIIISRIWRVNPIVVRIWVGWNNVHMTSKHQRFDILGPFPFIHQRVGIHFGAIEVCMTARKGSPSVPESRLRWTHTLGNRDSRYSWSLVRVSHRGSSSGGPRSS